jgi:hypothetical protein
MPKPAKNDHTGDKIQTKPGSKSYRDGYDAIQWSRGSRDKTDVEHARRSPQIGP